jgi:hypothetical protein
MFSFIVTLFDILIILNAFSFSFSLFSLVFILAFSIFLLLNITVSLLLFLRIEYQALLLAQRDEQVAPIVVISNDLDAGAQGK